MPRQQLQLVFGDAAPSFDPEFRAARRVGLDFGAWYEHVPGWVAGDGALFDALERGLPWRSETMHMYDREVAVPRLLARVEGAVGAGQPLIEDMRQALSARYGQPFVYPAWAKGYRTTVASDNARR